MGSLASTSNVRDLLAHVVTAGAAHGQPDPGVVQAGGHDAAGARGHLEKTG